MKFDSIADASNFAKATGLEIVIYKNKILEISKYKHIHPGGEDVFTKHLGKDITEAFHKVASHQTPVAEKEILNYVIGEIKNDSNFTLNQTASKKNKIDLKKGVVWQVYRKLNRTEYLDFIHNPTLLVEPNSVLMFDNPVFEFFSKTPWYFIIIIYSPLILYEIAIGLNHISLFLFSILTAIGFLLWTFIEYVIHKYLFHYDQYLKEEDNIMYLVHFFFHGIHHAFPMDRLRLVFPPAISLPLYFLIKAFLRSLLSELYFPLFTGIVMGYVNYDLTHYLIHHKNFKDGYMKSLRDKHIRHHYIESSCGFAVSNHIWDIVMGTESSVKNKEG